jgi:hypothetical protein
MDTPKDDDTGRISGPLPGKKLGSHGPFPWLQHQMSAAAMSKLMRGESVFSSRVSPLTVCVCVCVCVGS